MPFAPGNPGGGRPKDTPEMQEAKRLARKFSPEAIQFLIDTVRNKGESMKYRVQCAFQLLDRGLGKPVPIHPEDESSRPATIADIDRRIEELKNGRE